MGLKNGSVERLVTQETSVSRGVSKVLKQEKLLKRGNIKQVVNFKERKPDGIMRGNFE